jgi:hypothetical protein
MESPFPIEKAFGGDLILDGQHFRSDMAEAELDAALFTRDLPGEYSVKYASCWVGISTIGRRDSMGKRMKPRYVARVSVCF